MRKMTKAQIEHTATSKIGTICMSSNKLLTNFNSFDKIPSDDGQITIRSKPTEKKEDIIGYITVQIKGTQVEQFSKKEIRFSVKLADLINFKLHDGAIFFVVEIINANKSKAYFNSLLPLDIELLLKQCEEKKTKSATIHLKELQSNKILSICNLFLQNQMDQKRIPSVPSMDIQNFKKLEFIPNGTSKDIFKNLLNNDMYVKGLTVNNDYVYFNKVKAQMLEERRMCKVTIKGKKYYDYIDIQHYQNHKSIRFGNGIIIKLNEKNQPDIKYNILGNIYERIRDTEFLIDWGENLELKIDGEPFQIEINKDIRMIDSLKDLLNHLIEFKNLLDCLGIELLVDLSLLSSDDKKIINMLADIIIFKKYKIDCDSQLQSYDFNLYNKKVQFYITNNNESQEYFNFYDLHNHLETYVEVNNENVSIPCYHGCDAEDLVNQLNFNIISLEQAIIKCKKSNVALDCSIDILLQMIKCYDLTRNVNYLASCERTSNFLLNNYENNHIMIINHFQIIRRKRELTKQEKDKLISLKDDFKDDYKTLCGIYAVLGNKDEFDYYFRKLNNEVQDLFKSWAIYNLIN